VHQGLKPFMGDYTYTVTPRYFDGKASMLPLDGKLSASVTITVDSFTKGNLTLGFTRGYTQSQAFVHHFGRDAAIKPKDAKLQFDTSKVSGKNAAGETYTFAEEYEWLGFTARAQIFGLISEVVKNKGLMVDVFAYDFNEPDLTDMLLTLARQGRARIILDNAALHHSNKKPIAEDQFEKLFNKAAGKKKLMLRGKFGRYSHDKVFIVSKKGAKKNTAVKVLTGSTNFSVTGLYVNSNHVLIYDDAQVAGLYAGVFEESWKDGVKKPAFVKSTWAAKAFASTAKQTPPTAITFSPHSNDMAEKVLQLFGLRSYFSFVNGAEIGTHKWQQIQALREEGVITRSSVMIGDRAVDITAAHRNDLQAAGVLWGHGTRDELEAEEPRYLFSSPEELLVLTSGVARNPSRS